VRRLRLMLFNLGLRTRQCPMVVPPIGIMSLAAYARTKFDLDIRLLNQRVDNLPLEELVRQAVEFQPDVIGLSCITCFAHMLPSLTQQLRQGIPDARILLGGPHATGVRKAAMNQASVDAVVVGEGEITFGQILDAIINGTDFEGIPGLIWRDKEGEVRENPGQIPYIEDLDSLPMPAYDLIDLPVYWRRHSSGQVYRRKYATLCNSRGCPTHCIWCHNLFGKRLRKNSIDRMIEEINFFRKKYGVTDFDFCDDNFMIDRDRAIEFCDRAIQKAPGITLMFPNGVRGDAMTAEVVDALAAAGMKYAAFSLESGSPRIQKLTRKHLNIPRFLEGARLTAAKGVYVHGFCMMGFPTETEAELQQTIDVACSSAFHSAAFFTVIPFPGTVLYAMMQQEYPEKLANLDYVNWAYADAKVNLTDLPDSVFFSYQRKAVMQFFRSPRRIVRLLRAHPQRHLLPLYLPIFLGRVTKGLLWKDA